ncbi:Arginyltransferase 1 [Carabus blaptoides fortunei]
MAHRNISIVHWDPELEKHKCGYCKKTDSNCSYGMWAESLTVEDYQYLIDRGWRRSGKYCYKPVMDITCCPLYTIRCNAKSFKLSKSQKKIIKRVNRYLSDSLEDKSYDDIEMHSDEVFTPINHEKPIVKLSADKIESGKLGVLIDANSSGKLGVLIDANSTMQSETDFEEEENTSIKSENSKMSTSTSPITSKCYKPGTGADPSKPPCKKAKFLRLERKQHKLAEKGINPLQSNAAQSQEKSLEQFINDISKTPAHRLTVKLVLTGGNSRDWSHIRAQEYTVYRKYQVRVHGDPPDKCSEKQFTGFLLESPIQYVKFTSGPPSGYGSFHQQYWLDDKLIAVGVIDILPKCISSVYFFYDPDYRYLTLGTYGSLRELYFVREIQRQVPAIKYYYMGFYIHSCPKMRYKANLHASYLLCPETYVWFPIEQCIPKLDKGKYCRFNEDLDAIDKDECSITSDMDPLMILIGYKNCVPYRIYKEKVQGSEANEQYC